MKSNILSACRRSLGAVAGLLVLGGLASVGQAQTPPYGTTWDCILSGSGQQGIAFLTFSNDFTFSGYELLVGKQRTGSSGSSDGRNVGGDLGRGTSTDTNAPSGSGTNLFGYGTLSGPWHYDTKGRVVGYFLQIVDQQTTVTTNTSITISNQVIIDTNTVPPTTVTITTTNYTTTYVTNTTATTNGVSFSAKVVPGKRLTLVSSTPNGKVTYKGVPQSSKPLGGPIVGRWNGVKKQNKQDTLEFFSLLPTGVQNIYYTTNGEGPGFKFGAVSMVSVQKKVGFAFVTFEGIGTNDVPTDAEGNFVGGSLSATIGPINYPAKGTKANTSGFEQEALAPFKFQAQRQGP